MSECAKKYAAALSNPWSDVALGCCLPIEPVRPSQKIRVRATVSVVCGTAGVGFVMFSPCIANDWFSYYYTTSTYAGTSFSCTLSGVNTVATTGVAGGYFSDIPYTSTYFQSTNTGASARIAAVGLKATHTSAKLTRQGVWYAYVNPDHSCNDGINPTSYAQMPGARILPIDVPSVTLTSGPTDVDEYDWHRPYQSGTTVGESYNYPWSNGTWFGKDVLNTTAYGNGAAPLIVGIVGGAAGQSFLVDLVLHVEYSGKNMSGLTLSHNDERAAKALLTANSRHNTTGNSPSSLSFSGALAAVKNVIGSATEVINVGQMVKGAYGQLKNLLGNGKAASTVRSVVSSVEEIGEAGELLAILA